MRQQKDTIKIILALILAAVCSMSVRPAQAREFMDDFKEGQFALAVQHWDRAVKLFSEAIKKKPDFAPAYHNRAVAYSKKGDYDKSIEDLKKVIQLQPDNAEAYGLLAMVYEIKKDYASALKVYRDVLPRVKDPGAKKVLERWISDMETKSKQAK